MSDDAKKAMGREIRRWRINRRSDQSLGDLAETYNPVLQGWINYYGRFYKSMLYPLFKRLNEHLARWAARKYKRLHHHFARAVKWLQRVARRDPSLFAHWRLGLRP